jgi:hypothetical protein
MSETISWSLTAGGVGSGINVTGATTGDAIVAASIDLDAGSAERALTLQVDNVDKITFLAISSDLLDGKVKVKATGSDIELSGPILLFGKAVALFASDLTTLTVHNTSVDKAAKLSVLIGLTA